MEPSNTKTITPHEKAVQINLDRRFYGTFAEIGAGQEVARWFFVVGGASGTLAKTISAYDMAFSDAIYGKGERYVSQPRLQNMLDYEFALLIERLNEKRGKDTSFFVFADTVSARNYFGTNECHGWLGIKFQMQPQAHSSEIIIHVNMLDKENLQQQEALGIIGVNLIYGAFYLHTDPVKLIASLLDGLSTARIEVDMIKFIGPYFRNIDNRLMSLQLVEQGLSNATLIGADGDVLQPSEVLHKKPILVERGSFRPVTLRQPRHARRRAPAVSARCRGETGGHGRAHGNHHAQFAQHRLDRPQRLPRPRRHDQRRGQDGAHLQLRRVLQARRLPPALHQAAHRHRSRHPEPEGTLRREVLRHRSRAASSSRSGASSRTTSSSMFIRFSTTRSACSLLAREVEVPDHLRHLFSHLMEN